MGAQTAGTGDTTFNDCGIAQSHAYSVLSTFTMTDGSGTEHNMILMRNPWGITYYNGLWNDEDSNWTQDLIDQVPWGIDPTTQAGDGFFTMDIATFNDFDNLCLDSY